MTATFNIYRREIGDTNPPALIATGLTAKEYSDITMEVGKSYLYSVGAVVNAVEKVSNEIAVTAQMEDEHAQYVLSLLRFENNFLDEKGNAWTQNGNAAFSTDAKFGSYALSLPAGYGYIVTSDIEQADRNWYLQDYTIEAFVKPSQFKQDLRGRPSFIFDGDVNPGTVNWQFGPVEDGALCFAYWSGSIQILKSGNNVLLLNKYSEIAMTYEKAVNIVRLFVDGVKVLERSAPAAPGPSRTTGLVIGLGGDGTGDGKTRGLLDSFRLTKGICRYKNNYEPSNADFPLL